MNSVLSSSAATLSVIFIKPFIHWRVDPTNKFNLKSIQGAMLSGLVAVNASVDNIEHWAAILIGIIATVFYSCGSKIYERLHIDEPTDSSLIHAIGGFWGVLAVGFFDNNNGIVFTGNFHLFCF